MPRRERDYVPGLPCHSVQRGNNRDACFAEAEDCHYYLQLCQQLSSRYEVGVHSFCLMTNHVHVLATPETEASISRAQRVTRAQRVYTLCNGQDRSTLLQVVQRRVAGRCPGLCGWKFAGALHHLTARGNERRSSFLCRTFRRQPYDGQRGRERRRTQARFNRWAM